VKKNLQVVADKPPEKPLAVFTEQEYQKLLDIEMDLVCLSDLTKGSDQYVPVRRFLNRICDRLEQLNDDLQDRIEKAKEEQ
jgi:hypothetical protein